ncbi:hypothetical protein [Adonisia turfae]|uniref:DUF4760 domain-containing protein n=1 Tax=Adonisia turfae CCMR0081 TaxID=2292702 RepID=A0A6M0RGL9_9CYAN|nr:hypothetical protein [Adonisia turfae]NEZ54983.1 hypothetical protein [Adonisia turfae CCMR0081]
MDTFNALATFISGASAVIGLFFVGFQLRSSERLAKAQFINELARDIDNHAAAESYLDRGGQWYTANAAFSQEDKALIEKYLNFFERVKFILDTKVIDMETVDDLFAYRFFYLVHNPNVQSEILFNTDMQAYYRSIFCLYSTWLNYRKSRKLSLPRQGFLLKTAS